MSVNKAILVGNLGKDPDLRFTGSGKAVCKFSIATSSSWTDADGTRQERTEWHTIITWSKLAENCHKFLSKGRQVFVEGEIRSRSYDDKDGVKRYVTEIVAQTVRFLGGGQKRDEPRDSQEPDPGTTYAGPDDDDIPF